MSLMYYPAGRYTLTETLVVHSGDILYGDGQDTVFEATGDFPAITVLDTDASAAARSTLRDFSIERSNTLGTPASTQADSHGILFLGTDALIENIWIRDCYTGVSTDDASPTVSERLVLRNIRVTHSNSTVDTCLWGFQIDGVRNLAIEHCTATEQWLDGLKIRKNCRNVLVLGGCYYANGVSGAGDGIDAYSGGQHLKILGAVCEDNASQGINIKTGPLSAEPIAEAAFGFVKAIEIAHCTCRANGSIGLDVNRSTAENPTTDQLANSVSITGCVIEDSENEGLHIRGRNVTVTGCIVRNNGLSGGVHGAVVSVESLDVTLSGCLFIANGAESVGISNLYVAGTRVSVLGCTFTGKDAQAIDADGDFAGLTAQAAYGCLMAGTADDVLVRDPVGHSHTTALVGCQGTVAGTVLVHMSGSGSPETVVVGSVGSTFSRTDGGAGTSFYVKETAASADIKTGWAGK